MLKAKTNLNQIIITALGATFAAGCGLFPGFPGFDGPANRIQGNGVYDQQLLADIQSSFELLVVSPSGKRVAFSGRESQSDYGIYVGDLGGKVHKLAQTGNEPSSIFWSGDERTLTYLTQLVRPNPPGTPAGVPAFPTGKAVFQLSVDGGEPRLVPGIGDYISVAPTADRAMLGSSGGLVLVDFATVAYHTGPPSLDNVVFGSWTHDGQTLAFTAERSNGQTRNRLIATAKADTAESTELLEFGDQFMPTQFRWSVNSKTLNAYGLTRSGDIERITLALESGTHTIKDFQMPQSPIAGHPYSFSGIWVSPDETRVLLRRSVVVEGPESYHYTTVVPAENVLLTLADGSAKVLTPDTEPIAWLNDHQFLGYLGKALEKRLVIHEMPK
jgi:hypothetical protein